VLLRHSNPEAEGHDGLEPILITHFFGPGRTLFMASDETYHWRSVAAKQFSRFWLQAVQAIANLATMPSAAAVFSSLFWLVLLLAPTAVGMRTLQLAWRNDGPLRWHPLPVIAVAFAAVSTHYEIPIYLVFSSSLTLTALLLLFGGSGKTVRRFACGAALAMTLAAVLLNAGQPLSRGILGTIAGVRTPLDAPATLPGASLAVERQDWQDYSALLAFIDRSVPPGVPILALPVNPEIYFLSRRPAIYRFNSTAIGIRNDEDLRAAIERFDQAPPPIVRVRSGPASGRSARVSAPNARR